MDGLTMFALAKAAEMTYWRTAAQGTTLRKMYDLYESQSILGALKNLFYLRGDGLAVVSVLCFISALRGPLFQRASMVDGNAVQYIVGKQELKVAQLIPPNFLFQGSVGNPLLFDAAYNAYMDRAPILINITNVEKECGDKCEGKVNGYGFEIKCSDVSNIPWDNSSDSVLRQMYQGPDTSIGSAVPSFNSSAVLPGQIQELTFNSSLDDVAREAQVSADQQGWFQITNLFKSESVCGGNLSIHKCSLHHAVVEYNVILSNGILSLRNQSWQDDNVLFQTPTWSFPTTFAPTQDFAYPWGPTVHWVSWFMAEFNEEIDIYSSGKKGGVFGSANMRHLLAKRFIDGDINDVNCSTTFRDPTQFVLDRLREMAFRTAVVAATVSDPVLLFGNAELAQEGLSRAQNWTQNVELIGQRQVAIYNVSIPFLTCAIVCSLLAVVAIVPLYWKARSEILVLRSFNPLDVAHIFDAPLFQCVHEKDMETYVRKELGLRRPKADFPTVYFAKVVRSLVYTNGFNLREVIPISNNDPLKLKSGSFILSPQFTFFVGEEGKPIVVHAAAIAATSHQLDALINGGMQESETRCAKIEDVKVDDFIRFCEYAYRGDYTVPPWEEVLPEPNSTPDRNRQNEDYDSCGDCAPISKKDRKKSKFRKGRVAAIWDEPNAASEPVPEPPIMEDYPEEAPACEEPSAQLDFESQYKARTISKTLLRTQFNSRNYLNNGGPKDLILQHFEPKSNSAADQNFTPVLLAHARLYCFAHLRLITALKALTLYKLHKTLMNFKLYTKRVGDIIELARYAYWNQDLPNRSYDGTIDDLRKLVVEYIVCEIDTIGKSDEFVKYMEEGGEFVGDFWRVTRDYVA
ncbi:hypothetical protein yc1106_08977 [Curvularia clavata]|uniref:BTB domain-containing protein n=1 Tax=Curvularia clavata TaxID=95742 RepID=A0A9Q8ZJ90_CURCL|nr:hypothetical protein yc1106_08977 [Curvularia clavata]